MRFLDAMWARLSLRARMLLLTGMVLVGSGTLLQYVEAQRAVEEYRELISAEMDNAMDLLELAIGEQAATGDYSAVRRIIEARVGKPLIDEIRWRGRDGRVLEAKSSEVMPRAPALFRELTNLKPDAQKRRVMAGGEYYGTVSVHFSAASYENLLWERYLRQIGSFAVLFAALFAVIWFHVKNGLKPLENLAAAARRFLAGDFGAQVRVSSDMPPEIRDTLRMVNRAADSIGSLVLSLSEVRRATDNAAIVVESDLNGILTYANDKFCEISGYSLNELIGRDHRFLNSGHHPAPFFADLWSTISQGNVWRGEVCNRTKNGSLFWTNTTITPILGPDGKPVKYVAIRFDITPRKLAENKLWQQAQIIEQTHDAVFSTDMNGNVASWNRGAERLFGYPREEVLGNPIQFLCPEERYDFFRIEALEVKRADVLETKLRRKSGEIFDAHLSLTMLEDHKGAEIGMVGYAIDITERKLAEKALRESEAGLARAQQIAHIGDWDWNIENNTLRWSEEVYRIFGLVPQEFGASYDAFLNSVHPHDREYVQAAVNAALRGAPYNIDHRIVLPDGRIRFVHEQAEVTFDQNGRAVRMVGTVQDISERKRAMEELDRFKNVNDNTLDMIFMFEPDTLRFIYLNRGAVESLGYTREELLRMTVYQINPLLPESVFRAQIEPLLSGEKPSLSFETVHRHKDGTDFPVEIFLQLVKQGEGRGLFVAIGRDITERKRAELEIRESREQLRELSSYIQTAREQEKAKIAREIHDELAARSLP